MNKEEEEFSKIKNIRNRIHEDKEWGLVISRVPKQTKQIFTELADQEFCSDYGMTLRELLNQYLEYQQIKNFFFNLAQLQLTIADIQNRLIAIESRNEPVEKVIKTLDGKIKGKTKE